MPPYLAKFAKEHLGPDFLIQYGRRRMLNMALAGLLDKVFDAVVDINYGRKGLVTDGEEHEGPIYAEATHPTASKCRIQGFPRDAVHLACAAHRTRLQNVLRSPVTPKVSRNRVD
jgi:hypothetical protein